MFRATIVFALVALATAAPFNPDLDFHWENFKKIYNKHYRSREEGARRVIWEQNVASIIHHNLQADLGIHTYRKGLNEYADMTPEEFVKTMNGYKRMNTTSKATSLFVPPYNMDLPDSVDWRDEGLVTAVKNQEQCGSCWAFSTTGSLEGQHKKKTGKLVSLSEQNLVDCSRPEGNSGCEGGLMDQAFDYVKINKGIDTEKSYPYIAEDGKCHYKKSKKGATCTGFVDVSSGDEEALKRAVATVGPISVAIDASHQTFMMYKGGIYNEPNCSTQDLDHGVLVVGYGNEDGHDFWLVKNSWGTTWGEDGYVRMSRNTENQCGIATTASYPLV